MPIVVVLVALAQLCKDVVEQLEGGAQQQLTIAELMVTKVLEQLEALVPRLGLRFTTSTEEGELRDERRWG